jgi:hypothetical protein
MLNRVLLAAMLSLGLARMAAAANIIWVSDNSTPTAAGLPADKGWVDLLRSQGYTVDYKGEAGSGSPDFQYWRTLDAAKLSELDAADLVIISRNTDSAQYTNGAETAQWNAVKASMLSLSAYMVRSNRWGWVNATTQVTADAMMEVTVPGHPVFKGITLPANNQVDAVTSSIDGFAVVTSAGSGTLLARRADNGQLWIVEWPAASDFYSGSGRTAGGKRIYVAAASTMNLTTEGQAVFLNTVKYLLGAPTGQASNPSPANRAADVPRDAVLGWQAGPYARTHDVYLGTVASEVENATRANPAGVLASQGQEPITYALPNLFAFGQTTYWRVDEVNGAPDHTIFKGKVWSFEVEPYAYPIKTPIKATAASSNSAVTGPEKTIDGSGLNAADQHSISAADMWLSGKIGSSPVWIQYEFDAIYCLDRMWVWNSNQAVEVGSGFGARDVTIETSTDGTTWTPLAVVLEFGQATGAADYVHNTTVVFGGLQARFVRLTINANWGGMQQTGLSEVRFFYVPVKAYGPAPASASTAVALDAVLDWRPGRLASRHRVYLGSDPNAVINGTVQTNTTFGHNLALADMGLEYGRTYAWRVDEVNDAATPKVWEGDLWSFTTTPYGVVEDFESYDDACSRIFFAWPDGFGHSGSQECGVAASAGNATGSTVGNISPPFAERTIINSGKQAMPMTYDNTRSPFYSETQRQWSTTQAWTTGGANTLTLYFRGDPAPFLEVAPASILMSGMGTDIYNTTDQGRFAYKSLAGDGSIVARVDGLANTNAWAKAGVMIREALDSGAAWALVPYAGTNGVHFMARPTAGAVAVSDTSLGASLPAEQTGARAPVWVRLDRKGNQFNGYYATDAAGTAWKPFVWNPQTITMATNVYIGLAVTSHAAGQVCGARFFSVSTTGKVSGAWQTADLGLAQPTTGNSPETVYVAVQDSQGRTAVASHPDPTAIAGGAWSQWDIPLGKLGVPGVDLNKVRKLVIGVGDRNSPKSGSAGKLYIDDVRLTRSVEP